MPDAVFGYLTDAVQRKRALLRSRGFVGPRYSGLRGRARFVLQYLFVRRDVVLVATPATAVSDGDREVTLLSVRSAGELAPFEAEIDAAYHAGYTAAWRNPLGWGEELFLAVWQGTVVGFGWVQDARDGALASYYGPLAAGDRRVLRVGVLPAWRRRGLNTIFYRKLLQLLFSRGAMRVYIDCSRDNTPSLAAQVAAGFRPIGELDVSGRLIPGTWIRWHRATELDLTRG